VNEVSEKDELIRRLKQRDDFWKDNAEWIVQEIEDVLKEMYRDEANDIPVTLTSVKATLIQRQIVLYVDKETFEEIVRKRKGTLEEVDSNRQFYMDIASICFINELGS